MTWVSLRKAFSEKHSERVQMWDVRRWLMLKKCVFIMDCCHCWETWTCGFWVVEVEACFQLSLVKEVWTTGKTKTTMYFTFSLTVTFINALFMFLLIRSLTFDKFNSTAVQWITGHKTFSVSLWIFWKQKSFSLIKKIQKCCFLELNKQNTKTKI